MTWLDPLRLHMPSASSSCVQLQRWLHSTSLFLVLLLWTFMTPMHGAQDIVFPSTSNMTVEFNHLAVDSDTGVVYVGAQNVLYQLTADLSITRTVKTGPVRDDPSCRFTEKNYCNEDSYEFYNNENKILLIDKANGNLVTCGSVHQGSCQTRNLTDISDNEVYYKYVAANNAELSTVAFIAPGPNSFNGGSKKDMLYVGATFHAIEVDSIRSVPAVCTRYLQGIPASTVFTVPEGRPEVRLADKTYLVKYVTGFSVGGSSYFLTNQQKDPKDKNFVSHLISICQDDPKYKSFVEIPIECNKGGTKYNLVTSAVVVEAGELLAKAYAIPKNDPVIVATFVKSVTQTSTELTKESAVCVYAIANVKERIVENIQRCYRGQGDVGKQYSNKKCFSFAVDVQTTYCDNEASDIDEDMSPLVGTTALVAEADATYTDDQLTAIAVDITTVYTIAFLGNSVGKVYKVQLGVNGEKEVKLIKAMDIGKGSPILQDMVFTNDRKHLYVMTTNKLVKVPVEDCAKQGSCHLCRLLEDPYCGWCSLEKKCASKNSCSSSSDMSNENRWLSLKAWKCIKVTSVTPNNTSIRTRTPVDITVDVLPSMTDFKCVFGNLEESATIVLSNEQLRCIPPVIDQLPEISSANDHVDMTLALKSVETGINFLDMSFTLYDCAVHTSCSSCTTAKWRCNWCTFDNKCVDHAEKCVTQKDIFTDEKTCPRLETSGEILIPAQVNKRIELHGRNFPEQLSDQDGYECLIYLVQTKPTRVHATRVNSTYIYCNEHSYNYDKEEEEQPVAFELVWNRSFTVDGSSGASVVVYKCSVKGPDCSLCVSLSETAVNYSCVWCGDSCNYRHECTNDLVTNKCPLPRIDSVTPLSSPLTGGTRLTIVGQNLGTNKIKVRNAVSIVKSGTNQEVKYDCTSIDELYQISKRIVCRVHKSSEPLQGIIQVTIDSSTTAWEQPFFYRKPEVQEVRPSRGPRAGGTLLSIVGKKLDTGANQMITLGGNMNCTIIMVSDELITCKTPSSAGLMGGPGLEIKVQFDMFSDTSSTVFSYTENPNITSINPVKAYVYGGRMITVTGTHLDTVLEPEMFFQRESIRSKTTMCKVKGATRMDCPSPYIPNVNAARTKRATVEYEAGFIMDGVEALLNMSGYLPDVQSRISVVPDPIYQNFSGLPLKRKVYKGDSLVLEGERLNLACGPSEVQVKIGDEICEVSSLSATNLVCIPPGEQPAATPPAKYPVVTVEVGTRLKYDLGELEYELSGGIPKFVIIIISVAGGILIFIIIIIVIHYQRKKTQAERQYKKMQIQLDTLESNVRNECKQAFAELQTEVTDLTSDIENAGIPFWDYKTYTFKVLFPSMNDHPVLHYDVDQYIKGNPSNYEQGLQKFNQLLNCKQFLVIFIRTIEAQKNFSIRDKAVVASLLMVVLQDKMEYATDILKALLNELIDRSVEKRHPKLMLRRTESVVEKLLTNWMSICMFGYLKKHAGKSLFMLFKAIKHQTEKGPVDAITSEARYSLSEDRLLREKIEPKTLTISLVVENEKEVTTCKVLDCDTITQAKEKALDAVYMNTPFSRRPSVYDWDLEWRSGRSGHLPLQDEDVTTTTSQSGWKRVNTLAHYHVADGACMVLVPRRDAGDYLREVHGRVELTGLSAPIITMEEGTRVWHLVKHDDSQNQSRTSKVISEIFLTRLLSTKGTVQQFIDDLFMTILRVDNTLPLAIKYLFDFLDTAARRHNLLDAEIVHTWKSNRSFVIDLKQLAMGTIASQEEATIAVENLKHLPLRFWVNIIKNPEFVFDVHKAHIVDSCLSVIAQTFMDSCSTSDHKLGKDSPSNKLLFARDIPRYKKWVEKYYKDIQDMPPVSDHDMYDAMLELSRQNLSEFNVSSALRDLYKYAQQYSFELLEALDEDPSAKKLHLAHKFEQVTQATEGGVLY